MANRPKDSHAHVFSLCLRHLGRGHLGVDHLLGLIPVADVLGGLGVPQVVLGAQVGRVLVDPRLGVITAVVLLGLGLN